MTTGDSFYAGGLRFSCTRCSDCCRHESGFVFLSRQDLGLLVERLKMKYSEVMERYCRWVSVPGGQQLSLKEKANFDCIFWQDGCDIYDSRPLQCRTFPFWDSILSSPGAWEGLDCPGAGKGALHSREYIESCLAKRRMEPVVTKGGR